MLTYAAQAAIVWWIQEHLASVKSWSRGSECKSSDSERPHTPAHGATCKVARNADVTGRAPSRVLIVTGWGKVSKPWQSPDTVSSKVQELLAGMDAPVLPQVRLLQACQQLVSSE